MRLQIRIRPEVWDRIRKMAAREFRTPRDQIEWLLYCAVTKKRKAGNHLAPSGKKVHMSMLETRGWLDLKHAAEYLCLSVRTLRACLGHSQYPLPCYQVGSKWLCYPRDLDRWVQSFPRAGEDTDRIVGDVLRDLEGGKHASK